MNILAHLHTPMRLRSLRQHSPRLAFRGPFSRKDSFIHSPRTCGRTHGNSHLKDPKCVSKLPRDKNKNKTGQRYRRTVPDSCSWWCRCRHRGGGGGGGAAAAGTTGKFSACLRLPSVKPLLTGVVCAPFPSLKSQQNLGLGTANSPPRAERGRQHKTRRHPFPKNGKRHCRTNRKRPVSRTHYAAALNKRLDLPLQQVRAYT